MTYIKQKIAIIGAGYVGKGMAAVLDSARHTDATRRGAEDLDLRNLDEYETIFVDPGLDGAPDTVEEIMDEIYCAIICVPTPRGEDGSCDTSIVEKVIAPFLKDVNRIKMVLIKSTIDVGFARDLEMHMELNNTLNISFSPEFLRGRHAIQDSIKEDKLVIGSMDESVSEGWQKLFGYNNMAHMGVTEAAIAKYAENMFLATRVTFFNTLYDVVEGASEFYGKELDYDAIRFGLALDPRIGISHSQVPGYDGKRGWGGHCLPKDTSALVNFARKVGVEPYSFANTRTVNEKHRGENPDFEEVIE